MRAEAKLAPRVMIVVTNRAEKAAWEKLAFVSEWPVPGFHPAFPSVRCTSDGVCLAVTGMGYANASASMMALTFDSRFDFRRTYFLLAGISGISPLRGTLGSATWARFVGDFGLAHEIDARELPAELESGYFAIRARAVNDKPDMRYGTELYTLSSAVVGAALDSTRGVRLADSSDAERYRSKYTETAASAPPTVLLCDTLSSNTYWHGKKLGERAERWLSLLTDGKGIYCTTQQEDSASLEALKRAELAKRADFSRVAVLRVAANFDRPQPGQSPVESLSARSGGFPIAIENLTRVGGKYVETIVSDWKTWESGPPTVAGVAHAEVR